MKKIIVPRKEYVDKLIKAQGNGLVKIVTGGRRCGKSYLLFNLFHDRLLKDGVSPEQIIEIALDDLSNEQFRNANKLLEHIEKRLHDDKLHYVILDEVQLVDRFVELLLSLMHKRNVEVYVSGSNSKFLSKDVVTEFRGRGQEIRVWPLTFSEYYEAVGGPVRSAWADYYTYGGLPQVLNFDSNEEKASYLRNLYELTYINDVVERNHIKKQEGLQQLVQILSSGIGSYTNQGRISNTFKSVENLTLSAHTIKDYCEFLKDAFLIEEANRYDVKGRKYIGSDRKYYFCDLGLRNVILNFRQIEENHIMENIIYNELRKRGYSVDVGKVESWTKDKDGKWTRANLEVDFVVNNSSERVYIQSAFRMPLDEKVKQEHRPLLNIDDGFRKVVIVGDDIRRKVDENGIVTIGLMDFLLDSNSITHLLKN